MEASTPKIISREEAKAQGLKRYYTGKLCAHFSPFLSFGITAYTRPVRIIVRKNVRKSNHKWPHREEHRAHKRPRNQ